MSQEDTAIPIDPMLQQYTTRVTQAISELSAALEEVKLNGRTVLAMNIPTAEELLNILDKKITEAKWTDEEILEQVEYDKKESIGEHIPELEALEPEPEPLISYAEAVQLLSKLNTLFQSKIGAEFTEARALFPKLTRNLCKKINSSLEQTDIWLFFK
ncbi:uncharacterized protein FOMMEDRAFT_161421 [Fomitiporia mediterranea MF3/22]|uniref:uncharacterized protein n=1 Tax=Fomitiporia mediterranea (strain MF3/22) TaxID=694068 RepID=UPI0004407A6F|nr:uncharacterized protein FOMMEDRAFT_161421 [Fomitiporia mediterranea MF3/22]EJC98603.1 hypothetical protein FOMMEDRAFT_161421 [Fomitiporia mediterranea MF3/22]